MGLGTGLSLSVCLRIWDYVLGSRECLYSVRRGMETVKLMPFEIMTLWWGKVNCPFVFLLGIEWMIVVNGPLSFSFDFIKNMIYTIDRYHHKEAMTMDTAKVFQNGRSQAVRIPKKFRFTTSMVSIRAEGDSLVLTPVSDSMTLKKFLEMPVFPDFNIEREAGLKEQKRDLF